MKRDKLSGPAQSVGDREQGCRADHCQRRRCNAEAEAHGTVEVSSRLAAAETLHRQKKRKAQDRGLARTPLKAGDTRKHQELFPFLLAEGLGIATHRPSPFPYSSQR